MPNRSPRRRPTGRRRAATAVLALATLLFVALGSGAANASLNVTVVNTGGDGVASRPGPHLSPTNGYGAPANAAVTALCWDWGDAVGPYNNRLWWQISYAGRVFWAADRYLSTPNVANQPPAGQPQCNAAPPPPPPPPPPPAAGSLPALNVQPPFSGTWNRFGDVAPPQHRPLFGGDGATDVYAAAGTAVQVRAWPVSQQGAVQYKVVGIQNTCANAANQGGQAVRVEFYYNGVDVGWALYGHLDRLQVSVGQWVPHGQTLGFLRQWSYNSCYAVSNANGVHTHMEVYSNRNWACYLARPSNTHLDYWGVIGRTGGNWPAEGGGAACPGTGTASGAG